jgi:antitoxin component of MazEF toxin-antitoxin module
MEAEAIARKWGNSLGVIIPKEIVEQENLKPNMKIKFEITRSDDISHLYGIVKRKMTGQQFKDAARKGWE